MIVVATLVVTGFNAVTTVTDAGCETIASSFRSSMMEVFDANRNPGSFQLAELNAPCDATMICLGYTEEPGYFPEDNTVQSVENAGQNGVSQNIFLIRNQDVVETYTYDNFEDDQATCITTTGGNFALQVEGHTQGRISVEPGR